MEMYNGTIKPDWCKIFFLLYVLIFVNQFWWQNSRVFFSIIVFSICVGLHADSRLHTGLCGRELESCRSQTDASDHFVNVIIIHKGRSFNWFQLHYQCIKDDVYMHTKDACSFLQHNLKTCFTLMCILWSVTKVRCFISQVSNVNPDNPEIMWSINILIT